MCTLQLEPTSRLAQVNYPQGVLAERKWDIGRPRTAARPDARFSDPVRRSPVMGCSIVRVVHGAEV